MSHPASSNRQRRGVTSIEFALVAPLFFVLMLGIIEFGRAFMVMELLNESARQACRQAIVEGTSSAQIKLTATNFLTSVGFDSSVAGVSVNNTPIDTIEIKTMGANTDMTVQVTVPVSSVTWVPTGFLPAGNLAGQFTMRRE